jgi:uncharacterized protein
MPKIVETIITTLNADGSVYIAPLGLIAEGPHWVIAPFKPSRTLDNLSARPVCCASHVDDVRVFAGGVTGRKSWPTTPASNIAGAYLASAVSHWELAVAHVIEDVQRPRFVCAITANIAHRPWGGYNRAQAAVIEGAVLVTRLHMLSPEKIDTEFAYLQIAITKTAGPLELEAWGWLTEKLATWRNQQAST